MTTREERHNRQHQRAMEREARKRTAATERASKATEKVIRSLQTGAADEVLFLSRYVRALEHGLGLAGVSPQVIQTMRLHVADEHRQAGGGDYR
jgi:hypothetical protein